MLVAVCIVLMIFILEVLSLIIGLLADYITFKRKYNIVD